MSNYVNGHYHNDTCPAPRHPQDGRTYTCNGKTWLPVIDGHKHDPTCTVEFAADGSGTFTCDATLAGDKLCLNQGCGLSSSHDGFCVPVPDGLEYVKLKMDEVNMGEVRTTSSTGGEKGTKPERFDLIPVEAMSLVAQLYGKGAEKYAAHNWRKGYEWSKSYAALQRHANAFWSGEDLDPEMQLPHMASVVFHALTLITFMSEQPGFDDRFKMPIGADEKLFINAISAMQDFSKSDLGDSDAENN